MVEGHDPNSHADLKVRSLLLVALDFLLALEACALPPQLRMRGVRRIATYDLILVVIVFDLVTTVVTVQHLL